MQKHIYSVFFVLLGMMGLSAQASGSKLFPAGASAGDNFGNAVALDGDYAAIAAINDNGGAGTVYVFHKTGGAWQEQAQLVGSDNSPGNAYGISVAIHGNWIAVGAPEDNNSRGAVYLFERSGVTWTRTQKLFASNSTPDYLFGTDVSMDGDFLAVGSIGNNSNAGEAYVFTRSGSTWSETARMTSSDIENGDEFGTAVSISGDYLAVGAINESSEQGAAYVFHRSGGSWSEHQKIVPGDISFGDHFGAALSIHGDYLAVGSPDANSSAGVAYLFHRSGVSWSQQAKVTGHDINTGNKFGGAVALEGNWMVGGAINENNERGAAYLFVRTDGSSWTERQKVTSGNYMQDDHFGSAIAISGKDCLISAPDDDENGNNAGITYFYAENDDSKPVSLNYFAASAAEDGVTLRWTTQAEVNNERYLLERSEDRHTFYQIGEVSGNGTTNQVSHYRFVDNFVAPGQTCFYRLADKDFLGTVTYHQIVKIKVSEADMDGNSRTNGPRRFELHQNYPNPFNPTTTISYILMRQTPVNLAVYSITGEKVRSLVNETQPAGSYAVPWDGNDQAGRLMPSGVYIYKLEMDYLQQSRRMILLK